MTHEIYQLLRQVLWVELKSRDDSAAQLNEPIDLFDRMS